MTDELKALATADLLSLKYTFLVEEHGSFRRAAEFLSVRPSVVSRRIQALENALGAGVHGADKVGHWSGGVMRLRAA